MSVDLTSYFRKYEALVAQADGAFDRVKNAHADCVKCEEKCADCCFALFDLTLIEALYIHHKFNEKYQGSEKAEILEKSNRADRRIYKIKREAYKDLQAGKNEGEILAAMALERVRCPLLNEKELCDLYEYRPITCRFYGVPTAIGGAGHTCGKSGFKQGREISDGQPGCCSQPVTADICGTAARYPIKKYKTGGFARSAIFGSHIGF